MSRYQPYPSYKDSGVEWLGEVPKHWNLIRIGHLFKRTKVTDFVNEELLSVYRDYGVIPKSSRDDNNNKPSDDLTPYQLVLPGNLVMNKMKAWQGSIAISNYRGIVSPAYFVYTAEQTASELIDDAYLHHLLRSDLYIVQYLRYSKGIRINQWDLDPDSFKALEVLLPPQSEQKLISNFINDEHAKIDTLIAKQERMIELLDEKRSAIISHAVTKGLDPDVPMKDSGVEWLGEVPEHWKVTLLKRVASIQGGYAFSTNDFTDEGVQLVKISNLYQNKFSLDRQPTFVSKEVALKNTDFILKKGDLILSLTGTLGKRDYGYTVIIDQDGEFLLNQRVAKIIPFHSVISTMFVDYLMKSEQYLSQIYSLPFGTKQANLSNDNVMGASCVLPSLQEQNAIVNYLDTQTAKIDILIAKARQAIELMKERRIALISAAVTGKIDVRGMA